MLHPPLLSPWQGAPHPIPSPMGPDPHQPFLASQQLLTFSSPRHCPSHIPFAQQLLKPNLDLSGLLFAVSLIPVGRPRLVSTGTWNAMGLHTTLGGLAQRGTALH